MLRVRMQRQRPTENGQLNFLQCILSARPINGLFRAPDVQSVERPPIRGLISLDIKPSRRGRGGYRLRLQHAGSLPIPSLPSRRRAAGAGGRFDIRPPLVRPFNLAGHAPPFDTNGRSNGETPASRKSERTERGDETRGSRKGRADADGARRRDIGRADERAAGGRRLARIRER